MPTIQQLLVVARSSLVEPFEADWLLAHYLGRSRSWLIAHADEVLEETQLAGFKKLLVRRQQGEPVAYIIGRQGFWTLDLEVSPATLIPRPETELLVEQVLQRLPAERPSSLVDLGTGSGAIALALARERPNWQITAVDISQEALTIAQNNARRLSLNHVVFVQGDWLTPLAEQQFSAIVANPPYIEANDSHLKQGDLRFEPLMALASGVDGLNDIRHIVNGARKHLKPGGWLLLEHGWQQREAVHVLLAHAGYSDIFSVKDLAANDRVSGGRYA